MQQADASGLCMDGQCWYLPMLKTKSFGESSKYSDTALSPTMAHRCYRRHRRAWWHWVRIQHLHGCQAIGMPTITTIKDLGGTKVPFLMTLYSPEDFYVFHDVTRRVEKRRQSPQTLVSHSSPQ